MRMSKSSLDSCLYRACCRCRKPRSWTPTRKCHIVMWKGFKGERRGNVRGFPSPGGLTCAGSSNGFPEGLRGSRCRRRETEHRIGLRRREGGPRAKRFVLFLTRISVKGRCSSHMIDMLFAKAPLFMDRIVEGQSWKLGGQWADCGHSAGERGKSLNQDGERSE